MKIGFNVPVRGPGADPAGMTEIARRAETSGYDYIAVTDHVAVPRNIQSLYPYTEDGKFPGRAGEYLEPLSLMGFLAGITQRLQLLTSILVVPHRPAVLAAKMISSLDVMSGGRVILGIGAGWMREEFEAIGAPDFDARGQVTNEYLRAFKILWTEEKPCFNGKHVNFGDVIFEPKPIQPQGPRIWAGGESRAAQRRAVTVADGWYPVGNNPKFPLDTIERYTIAQNQVKEFAREASRNVATIDFAYWAMLPWTGEVERTAEGDRKLLTGSADELISDIQRLQDLGVSHLSIIVLGASVTETLGNVDRFADQIISKL